VVSALVWKEFFEWIKDREQYVKERFCKGEILKVEVPKAIAEILSQMQAELDVRISDGPEIGLNAFTSIVADVADYVAGFHRESNPSVAAALTDLSVRLQR